MSVVLRVKTGESFREICNLECNKPMIVGRLEQCDIAFPNDFEMSGRHLSLTLNSDMTCVFSDPGSTNGTFLNDKPVTEGILQLGDILRCGMTELSITSVGACGHNDASGQVHTGALTTPLETNVVCTMKSIATAPQEVKGFTGTTAQEIYERCSLEKEITSAPVVDESPGDYAVRLMKSCDENECLVFLGHALPKRCAVWWLTQIIRVVESFESDADAPMLELAEAWVRKPTDDSRREAMKMAEFLEMASPAAWAGVAAFWSHGSIAPPDAPEVASPDHLTGKAVIGGAILATVLNSPEKAPERRQLFTEIAIKISAGELPWSQAAVSK